MNKDLKNKIISLIKGDTSVLKDALTKVATRKVNTAVEYALCRLVTDEYPGNEFTEVDLGRSKDRKIIKAETDSGTGLFIILSDDYKFGYIDSEAGQLECPIEEHELLKEVFEFLEENLPQEIKSLLPFDPLEEAKKEFFADVRFGSEEYLRNEFLDIYNKHKSECLSRIPEELRTSAEKFLELDEDVFKEILKGDVHIVS